MAGKLRVANPDLSKAQAMAAAKQIVQGSRYLYDTVPDSFLRITNIARHFGIPEERIRELMGPWVRGALDDSNTEAFEWWKKTWTSIVDESPKLNAAGRDEFKNMWSSLVNDRAPGLIDETPRAPGIHPHTSTLYTEEVVPRTGEVIPKPHPAFEADMFQTWRPPSLKGLEEYFSHLQRTMNRWRDTGGWGKRNLSMARALARIMTQAAGLPLRAS